MDYINVLKDEWHAAVHSPRWSIFNMSNVKAMLTHLTEQVCLIADIRVLGQGFITWSAVRLVLGVFVVSILLIWVIGREATRRRRYRLAIANTPAARQIGILRTLTPAKLDRNVSKIYLNIIFTKGNTMMNLYYIILY